MIKLSKEGSLFDLITKIDKALSVISDTLINKTWGWANNEVRRITFQTRQRSRASVDLEDSDYDENYKSPKIIRKRKSQNDQEEIKTFSGDEEKTDYSSFKEAMQELYVFYRDAKIDLKTTKIRAKELCERCQQSIQNLLWKDEGWYFLWARARARDWNIHVAEGIIKSYFAN
eukprot:CAMPEP_0114972226 /NCGR_PEP_ID=MMETSP0216-20121206/277_1 /TAXON_ID=223996 /ORGANISM="Protocruzia adherens, Strain Boccale" /LENGTH=172 /DNA_ID=CAMNT_0002332575 /DNA_START=10 /DNA_END=529 /DNA_ORIENTATION=+